MAITPPTRVDFAGSTNYLQSATPRVATSSLTLTAGQLLTMLISCENITGTPVFTPSLSAGSAVINWTLLDKDNSSADRSCGYSWQGDVTAGGSATLQVDRSGGSGSSVWGFGCTQWSNHGGVGSHSIVQMTPDGVPQASINCFEGSALSGQINDWNAVSGSGRNWLSINGTQIAETQFSQNAGVSHTVYQGRSPNVGTAGSKTFGLASPSGTRPMIALVEVKGLDTGVIATDKPAALESIPGFVLLENGTQLIF